MQQEPLLKQASFANNFWSKNKSGMVQLLDYIKSTHDDLDIVYSIYTQRANLEKEFGEKLLALSNAQELDAPAEDGVAGAYQAIAMELKKTAESHIDLSNKLKDQVASELETKLLEYRALFDKWNKTLQQLYDERQEKTIELLRVRSQYLKEHDLAKGQSNPSLDKLKEQYKAMVADVDYLSQEWIDAWTEACETMEAMEEDRVELIKYNIWEYANLASARLLIQDEWCEVIRKQLEKCSAEEEIEKCISSYGTGSAIPTTNEYVGEVMKELKKKQPKPIEERDKGRMTEGTIRHKVSDNMGSTASRGQIKRKPLNKSLMGQVSQHHHQQEHTVPEDTATKEKPKSIEAILSSIDAQKNNSANRDFHRRQPSEYKPDTGSIPTRRGQRTIKEVVDAPEQPPKSPRPTAQVIQPEDHSGSSKIIVQQQQQSLNQQSQQQQQQQQHHQHHHQQPSNQHHAFPPTAQYQPYAPATQQQYTSIDQRSPMMQPQRSPMMQPQRSPMMQPQRSPMMQPVAMQAPISPMMQPQRSSMIAPQASPMMQPYQRSIPPPITIPNYMAPSPQPSPAMAYSSSPILRWPTNYIDGRPVIAWARSKYDYAPTDATEIPLTKHCLVGVLESDLSEESWWIGAVWDEYRQTWSNAGSVPGNFMEKL
ncbi:hypothetical protein RMATCC62417_00932 [Rhizopus microsporus]|nr:hypothetical protein RMATCC62417_00932 [Rhizopus microsporus]